MDLGRAAHLRVYYLDADGEPGLEQLRLAGDTLLWERDGITLRVEGARDLAEALEIAGLDGTLRTAVVSGRA